MANQFTSEFSLKIGTLFSDLLMPAIRAYNGASHDPEIRGKQFIDSWKEELNGDLEKMLNKGVLEGSLEPYADQFKKMVLILIGRRTGILNPMVTGPAKFPEARNRKRLNAERKASEVFDYWRNKSVKRLIKIANPVTNETEIQRLQKDLDSRVETQEIMKSLNLAFRAYQKKKASVSDSDFQASHKISDKLFPLILNHEPSYNTKNSVFAAFMLTNNNANIARIKARIEELTIKESLKAEAKERQTVFCFEGGEVEISYADDRFRIRHFEKPSSEIIGSLKKNGFKWSPSNGAWQRQLTYMAFHGAKMVITGLQIPDASIMLKYNVYTL